MVTKTGHNVQISLGENFTLDIRIAPHMGMHMRIADENGNILEFPCSANSDKTEELISIELESFQVCLRDFFGLELIEVPSGSQDKRILKFIVKKITEAKPIEKRKETEKKNLTVH